MSTVEAGTSRARRRARIEADILRIGREHLATHGAAALSLRAVARDLGMVSSAIYRYVDSRDELLTRLVVEAYDDLADTVERSIETVAPQQHRERLHMIASSFRDWARTDPARYALLYGSPVPGFVAPPERTVAPGTRVIVLGLSQLDQARADGMLREVAEPRAELTAVLTTLRDEYGLLLSDGQLVRSFTWWGGLIGITNQEIFDGYGAGLHAVADALFAAQLDVLLDQLFTG